MAPNSSAGADNNGRKPVFIRPAIPLKYEKKTPASTEISQQQSSRHVTNRDPSVQSISLNAASNEASSTAAPDLSPSSTNKNLPKVHPGGHKKTVGQNSSNGHNKITSKDEIPNEWEAQSQSKNTHGDDKILSAFQSLEITSNAEEHHELENKTHDSVTGTVSANAGLATSNIENGEATEVALNPPFKHPQNHGVNYDIDTNAHIDASIGKQHSATMQQPSYELSSPEMSSEKAASFSTSAISNSHLHTEQTTPASPGDSNLPGNLGSSTLRFQSAEFLPEHYPYLQQPFYPAPYYMASQQAYFTPHNENYSTAEVFSAPASLPFDSTFNGVPLEVQPSQAGPSTLNTFTTHTLQNFNNEKFADMILYVLSEGNEQPQMNFYLHKMLMARSETLANLISEYAGHMDDGQHRQVINLKLPGRFFTLSSLESALRTCYGELAHAFTGPQYVFGHAKDNAMAMMRESLGFAVAGNLLQLEDVKLRGLFVASMSINWFNLELAMSFALEFGDHMRNSADQAVVPLPLPSGIEPFQNGLPEASPPRNAYDLLSWCLRFLSYYCPHSFIFDPVAKSLDYADRLPSAISTGHRDMAPKSRFAQIQFGSQNAPAEVDEDKIAAVVSSRILISLPFNALTALMSFDRMNGGHICAHLAAILEERERRRIKIVACEEVDWNQRRLAKDVEWVHVGFREFIAKDANGNEYISRTPSTIYRTPEDEHIAQDRDKIGRGATRVS